MSTVTGPVRAFQEVTFGSSLSVTYTWDSQDLQFQRHPLSVGSDSRLNFVFTQFWVFLFCQNLLI